MSPSPEPLQPPTAPPSCETGRLGQRPGVLWFTGLSGAGKSSIARCVEQRLQALGRRTYLLDGDDLRTGLNRDLGFSPADRAENVRRVAEVARLMADAGLIVLTALISPFRAERDWARQRLTAAPGGCAFAEIHVATPLAVAEQRDVKGLYRRARAGELLQFTGIDSPYEEPLAPELRLDGSVGTPELAAGQVLQRLQALGWLD
ncbi:MAG: adenylyl-sulfate kinase [Burkholderiaceae bacterium]|nr:adenylyl-sulfate kinase [Burkholderiaceae bacterium]